MRAIRFGDVKVDCSIASMFSAVRVIRSRPFPFQITNLDFTKGFHPDKCLVFRKESRTPENVTAVRVAQLKSPRRSARKHIIVKFIQ